MIKVADLRRLVEFFERNKIDSVVIMPKGVEIVTSLCNMMNKYEFVSRDANEIECVRLILSGKPPHDAQIEVVKKAKEMKISFQNINVEKFLEKTNSKKQDKNIKEKYSGKKDEKEKNKSGDKK